MLAAYLSGLFAYSDHACRCPVRLSLSRLPLVWCLLVVTSRSSLPSHLSFVVVSVSCSGSFVAVFSQVCQAGQLVVGVHQVKACQFTSVALSLIPSFVVVLIESLSLVQVSQLPCQVCRCLLSVYRCLLSILSLFVISAVIQRPFANLPGQACRLTSILPLSRHLSLCSARFCSLFLSFLYRLHQPVSCRLLCQAFVAITSAFVAVPVCRRSVMLPLSLSSLSLNSRLPFTRPFIVSGQALSLFKCLLAVSSSLLHKQPRLTCQASVAYSIKFIAVPKFVVVQVSLSFRPACRCSVHLPFTSGLLARFHQACHCLLPFLSMFMSVCRCPVIIVVQVKLAAYSVNSLLLTLSSLSLFRHLSLFRSFCRCSVVNLKQAENSLFKRPSRLLPTIGADRCPVVYRCSGLEFLSLSLVICC
jgi:hypothetical protein